MKSSKILFPSLIAPLSSFFLVLSPPFLSTKSFIKISNLPPPSTTNIINVQNFGIYPPSNRSRKQVADTFGPTARDSHLLNSQINLDSLVTIVRQRIWSIKYWGGHEMKGKRDIEFHITIWTLDLEF
ncbi:hypothetical protein ACH5RR_003321 [Cinchona calisaya]|uniref:Uncharacterized protein n=1 Tax=Cinchona calisaya TaxID=153742 RepID=A0ABD3AUM5_9GENT